MMPNHRIPCYETDEQLQAWEQRVKAIMPVIRRTKAFQDVLRDFNAELRTGSLEDVNTVTQIMLEVAVDIAYHLGLYATDDDKQEICAETA